MPKKYFSDNKGISFTIRELMKPDDKSNEEWIKIPRKNKIIYNEYSRIIPEWVILFPKPNYHQCF